MTASRVRPFVFFAIAIGIAVGLFLAEPALAGAPALDGEKLFKERTCLTCHGVDAKTPILPEYPKLAGQNAAYMVQQIRDIKSGARNNGQTPGMRGVLHLVNDEEIVAIADYISKLKP